MKKKKLFILADDGYTMHQWRKERIWIEAINHENNSRKQWDDTWSFIADYDQKVCILHFRFISPEKSFFLNSGKSKTKRI